MSGLRGATTVAVGLHAACALQESGEVRCWGDNRFGQAGINDLRRPDVTRPGLVAFDAELGPVRGLACGRHYCCALHDGDEVSCWGAGSVFPEGVGDLHPADRVPAPRALRLDAPAAAD